MLLDHPDTGVVVLCDDAERNMRPYLSHDAGVAQRIDGHLVGIAEPFPIGQPAAIDDPVEAPTMMGFPPPAATRSRQQRRIWCPASGQYLKPLRQVVKDRH